MDTADYQKAIDALSDAQVQLNRLGHGQWTDSPMARQARALERDIDGFMNEHVYPARDGLR